MGARSAIILSFKRLVDVCPYDKITVNQICLDAGVSRKTFYSHFQNKAAIVNAVVFDAIVEPMIKIDEAMGNMIAHSEMTKTMPEMLNLNVYQAIKDDKDFYIKICNLPGSIDSPLVDALTLGIQELNKKIIRRLGFNDSLWKVDYISYYYAAGNALLIQRWIRGGFIVSPEELASLYNSMSTPFWMGMAGVDKREGL